MEAGLRTFDLQAPFPEEMNRSVTTQLAALHFAPTQWAADNLTRANVAADRIKVTGNRGIDAVRQVKTALESGKISALPLPIDGTKKLVVVTAHRRESFREGQPQICVAVKRLPERGDVQIVWPIDIPSILVTEPLKYVQFVDLMRRAFLIITDSGGSQEEGPSLGKPILFYETRRGVPKVSKLELSSWWAAIPREL